MKIGDTAPNFILKDETGEEFELYKNLDKMILLVFYPKDDTPVCSSQLSEYNDNQEEFRKNSIQVIGINSDSSKSHHDFCTKLNLKFPLLSDDDKTVSKLYEAINIFGINKRKLVLIGTDKRIKWTESTFSFKFIKSKEILEKCKSVNSKEMT